MPTLKQVHGYSLATGWKAVSIDTLFTRNLKCWEEYPTHSKEIEQGSFSAWPESCLEEDFENDGMKGNIYSTDFPI
jgi:hypothetical protein